jgi:hypothetical protein
MNSLEQAESKRRWWKIDRATKTLKWHFKNLAIAPVDISEALKRQAIFLKAVIKNGKNSCGY